jgi:hypothetical protein
MADFESDFAVDFEFNEKFNSDSDFESNSESNITSFEISDFLFRSIIFPSSNFLFFVSFKFPSASSHPPNS